MLSTNKLYLPCGSGYSLTPEGRCIAPSVRPDVTISPASAETKGAALAVVQGYLGSDPEGSVTIGGNLCSVSSYVSHKLWICQIPEGASSSVEVIVENYGHISQPTHFAYDPPRIESIEPQFFQIDSPFTEMAFTIRGSNFGASRIVNIGGAACLPSIDSPDHDPHEVIYCEVRANGDGWNSSFLSAGLLDVSVAVEDQSDNTGKACQAAQAGSLKCLCPEGQEYKDDECVSCTANHYSDGTMCIACPLGSVIPANENSENTGADSDACVCGVNAALNTGTGRCECKAGYGGDATVANVGCGECGTGAYKGDMGNTQCTPCPGGSSIVGGVSNSTDSDACVCGVNAALNTGTGRCECKAGYGGDATVANIGCSACGTGAYKGSMGNTQCTSCPSGSSISGGITNSTDAASCVCGINAELNEVTDRCECSAGYGGDATNEFVGCYGCGSSRYKNDVGNTPCTPCPSGSLITEGITNATHEDSCICNSHSELKQPGICVAWMPCEPPECMCSPGYKGSASSIHGCSECGTGSFKSYAANGPCTPCPAGSSISGGVTNATDAASCVCGINAQMNDATGRCECKAGYGGDATVVSIGCSACGSTGYKEEDGNAQCTPCPMGALVTNGTTNATDSESCVCGVNSAFGDESDRCLCKPGYGGDATSIYGCSPCGTGAYKGDMGNTQCTPCPGGSSIVGGVSNSTDSDACVCGVNAALNTGTGRCECKAGYGGDATVVSIGCSACGILAHKGTVGNTQCTPCPAGSSVSGGVTNATDSSSCGCGINAEMNEVSGRCECSAGYGGDATNSLIGCSPCGILAYKGDMGNTQCTPCPGGSSVSGGVTNATDSSSCGCGINAEMNVATGRCECSAGYGGDATNSLIGCSPCGILAYKGAKRNAQCTPCPAGSSVSGGVSNATDAASCVCGINAEMNVATGRCECSAGHGGDATVANIGCNICGTSAFNGDVGNVQCTPCPSGSTVRDGVTATSMEECFCDVGTVTMGSADTSISCQCAPGYFGSALDNTCDLCPVGGYKDTPGDAVACMPCTSKLGEGATTPKQGSLSSEECVCGNGYYMHRGMCMPCEVGALCPGGNISSMIALPGFWRSDPASTSFFSCESPNGYTLCMGGASNHTGSGASGPLCREGHEGLLCSKCTKGYGKTYGVCAKCDSSFSASGIIFVLFAIFAFFALLYGLVSNNLRKATAHANSKDEESIALSVVKIIINWLQMASIAAQVRVTSNESMDRFFQIQDVSNVSPFQFSSFNCMVQADYYAQFYSALAIPPACVILGLCLTGIHFLKRTTKNIRFGDMFVMVSQMLWFFTYSMVSQILLGIFECRDLDRGVSVLSADLSVQCETSKHDSAVKLGYIFGLLYIVGIPLQVFAQLYWYRGNLADQSVKVRYMFMFHNYREGLYWYECVNMLRKIGLVTALVLLQEDLGTQVFALSVISMTYLTLHAYIKPYTSRTLNELETAALFVTALTLSTCSFFYSNPTGTGNPVVEHGLTWSVIVLSTCLLICSLAILGKGGLVAFTRGKPAGGNSQLPSKISKEYLKSEDAENCVGSPSQFKSLLSHDGNLSHEGDPDSPASLATKKVVMANPLAQSQSQNGRLTPLPSAVEKHLRRLSGAGEGEPRGEQYSSPAVRNPLCPVISDLPGKEIHAQNDEEASHLPEKVVQKVGATIITQTSSADHEKVVSNAGGVENPLSADASD
ncbi:hypothetical protein A3770_09p54690 [Chloropicon primus]|uniref:IPT/TIG domain-containing protein n=1 Tax=Chloropicon primus TaxID=1764295 RepID=A0A5B8MRD7_9CHLO|nr:hypothetical protein A3770_09p54690 [Chloropicon primus]|eukprot:QDZ22951.1 hypothetical protein A3770_09p54690 [Chloropicon primus]